MKRDKCSVSGSPDTPGPCRKSVYCLSSVRKDSRAQPKVTRKIRSNQAEETEDKSTQRRERTLKIVRN